ncbi:hypothetical protein ACFQ3Z_07125 [Streptomyces nogalater]
MYAVLSVTDKTGITELGAGLSRLGLRLVATSGTAALLRESGLDATVVGDLSGVPELMGGRVRAFHPSVFGGLLYRRGHPADEADVRRHGVPVSTSWCATSVTCRRTTPPRACWTPSTWAVRPWCGPPPRTTPTCLRWWIPRTTAPSSTP